MAEDTGAFRKEEISVLREVLEACSEVSGDYKLLVESSPEKSGKIRGFLIYGPTPMTESTFDLYWIVVDSREQGKGVGKKLLQRMEKEILQHFPSARIRVETAGKEEYLYQRRFYLSRNFREAGRIPEFYGAGDDLVIFWKELSG
ncbi:MAG TPA: GNAT family N-acetyltransferase [Synergistaceae bacterium]|nr:GNAT family N-acetyltransferase [Synergistaceae bacterium]HPJ24535.1 GNAT family N-acetyltransferase [Synergistaceae bacterium]HPQ36292.1 GNAT family N-acetyltransferase [Synergistaceae bacterium]